MSENLDFEELAWRMTVANDMGKSSIDMPISDVSALIARIRELESFRQAVLDPENQPSQYGTILMERAQHAGEAKPVAWMTPSDWAKEPLATCSKSVANAWRYDNRQVTPLYAAPQPAALPEGWVPVSERLPEASGDYLVYRPDAHRMPAADPTVCIRYYTPGANRGNDCWRGAHRVTHWMPLPSAPQPRE